MSYEHFVEKLLGDRRYAERHRFPKWNVRPNVLHEPRLFPRVFPELTKADHMRLSEHFANEGERVSKLHARAVSKGEKKYGTHGSLISGGFRETWPDKVKDEIRFLAHSSSLLKDAAHAHARAAELRSVRK